MLQGKISPPRQEAELLATDFRLLFGREDGGDVFLLNVDWLSLHYTALYPRR
jgi:hypothetical protein